VSSRSVLQISNPSISGSITSNTIKSGVLAAVPYFERLGAIGCGDDGVTGLLQVELDQFNRFWFIIHDKDSRLHFSLHNTRPIVTQFQSRDNTVTILVTGMFSRDILLCAVRKLCPRSPAMSIAVINIAQMRDWKAAPGPRARPRPRSSAGSAKKVARRARKLTRFGRFDSHPGRERAQRRRRRRCAGISGAAAALKN